MKKFIFNFLFLSSFAFNLTAQDANIFHDRSFWSASPSLALVKEKVKAGNDPVALNDNAFDAITNAINNKASLDIVKYLLSFPGNDINKKTHDSRNYLMWAARTGNIPMVEYLLANGSNTDIVDSHGYNALTFAAAAGQSDTRLYEMILAEGVSVKSVNRSGANVLHLLAGSVKDKTLINYFIDKGLDINDKDADGNGIFNYAAKKGNLELMKILINDGIAYLDLNAKGENALMFASEGGRGFSNSLETYEFLSGLGMEVDIVNWEGKTPLHHVAKTAKNVEIINYFINKGVNPKQVDKDGNTAFLNAAQAANLIAVKHLLPLIKNINQVNAEGNSAVAYAVKGGSKEIFDLLVNSGADLNIIDKAGNNLVYHLFNAYSQRNKIGFEYFVQILKSNQLSFTDQFENGNTLIHVAVDKGSQYLLEQAIASGANINAINNDGLSALHLAAMKAHDQTILNILLANGADKKILTEFEESAFDLAKENESLSKNATDLDFLKSK